ncbi:MAG: hypothetical protein ACLGHS_10735 [Actinomycetes bacterium]
MSENTSTNASAAGSHNIRDWADLAEEMWSYLTGKGAAVNYRFIDMTVEVPRDTGAQAPRATWKLNGTLQITTSDNDAAGSDKHRS